MKLYTNMITDILSLVCYKNGSYIPIKDAGPSLLDFGFIHSDATYDVIKLVKGSPFLFEDHYQRFLASTKFYDLSLLEKEQLLQVIDNLVRINKIDTGFIWLISWRGTPITGNPRDINSCEKHLVVYIKPYYNFNTTNTANVVLYNKHNRIPDSSFGQQYKNFAWIDLTLAQRYAYSMNADTAILLNAEDCITEGPGFGVGFIFNGVVKVPKKDVLHSVTIKQIERICNRVNIPFEFADIHCTDSFKCDEMFLASTSGGVIPVSMYNGRPLNNHCIINTIQSEYIKSQT